MTRVNRLPDRIAILQTRIDRGECSDADLLALGRAWLDAGEPDLALPLLRRLSRKAGPHRAAAKTGIAAAQELKRLGRSPPGYVRHLFDQFAGHYDRSMVEGLNYSTPGILRSLADMAIITGERKRDILDLGCGTGLAGAAFADLAARLDGVDLSPEMVERARARGIYDHLAIADLEQVLQGRRRKYDLLLAADTLVYFGDLSSVFSGAYQRLRRNGYFLFTVEVCEGRSFNLGPKRRYRHSTKYLRRLAETAELEVLGILDCMPRTDKGAPVAGLAVALRRP